MDLKKVYQDENYTLGFKNNLPCLITNGKLFILTCHPYEPCLYITDENGCKTAVHNAFDPDYVLDSFCRGEIIESITGRKYTARDFCRMVEYAAGLLNINIDDAEKVFETDSKQNHEKPSKEIDVGKDFTDNPDVIHNVNDTSFYPEREGFYVDYDDPAYDVIDEYEDRAVEYCIVRNGQIANEENAYRNALVLASRELFFDGEERIWNFDCDKAEGKPIDTESFFAPATDNRGINYRGAFCYPPCGVIYSDEDFDRVNAVLFPNGTDSLEVCEWATDWSEFFDEGHEWWGALCYTVYDKSLDRFIVIMASATD